MLFFKDTLVPRQIAESGIVKLQVRPEDIIYIAVSGNFEVYAISILTCRMGGDKT